MERSSRAPCVLTAAAWGAATVAVVLVALTLRPPPPEPAVAPAVEAAIEAARRSGVRGEPGAAAALRGRISTWRPAFTLSAREAAIMEWEAAAIEAVDASPFDEVAADRSFFDAVANSRLPEPSPPGAIFGPDKAATLLLERVPAGLDDPRAPGYALARTHVALLLRHHIGAFHEQVEPWLSVRGADDPARYLPGLLSAHALSGFSYDFHAWSVIQLISSLPRRRVEAVLSTAAADPAVDRLTRRACEHWLGEVADLPIGLTARATCPDLLRDSFPEGQILDWWSRLKDAPPDEALKARLRLAYYEFAVAAMPIDHLRSSREQYLRRAPRTDTNQLEFWVLRHTGLSSPDLRNERMKDWIAPSADVAALLRAAVLGTSDDDVDLRRLLERLEGEEGLGTAAHQLLLLNAPAGTEPPTWMATDQVAPGIAGRWRAALHMQPRFLSLRTSQWSFDAGRWRLVSEGLEATGLDEGGEWVLRHADSEVSGEQSMFAMRVPGRPWPASVSGRYEEELTVRLGQSRGDAALAWEVRRRLHADGKTIGWRDDATEIAVPFTVSPTLRRGTRRPDRFRNRLSLVRSEWSDAATPGDAGWTAGDWHEAITADVARMAALAEAADPWWKFHNTHQTAVWNVAATCTALGVPDALPALERLLTTSKDWNNNVAEDALLLACLANGAAELADDPRVKRLAFSDDVGAGPSAWLRVLVNADDPRVRARAESALQNQMTPEVAADLLAAHRAGVAPVSDALLATARDARGEVPTSFVDALTAEPGLSSPAVAGATLLIGLLLVVATASLTGRDCPRIGAVLVLLGLAAVAITVRVRAVDLLPDRLGLAAAAAGTWHLGRVARSRWGAVAALAFGLAAFAAWTFPAAETLATCAGVVASFGLGSVLLRSIPHVGAAPPRRAVSARLRPALLVVLLVALGAGTYHSLAEASTQLGHAAVASTGLAVGLALGTAAPAFLDPRTRSVRRAISPAFVAMYVLPVGALLVATDDSTWAPAARYVALAGAVWCVARLLDAAWLHARRARTPTAVTSGRA